MLVLALPEHEQDISDHSRYCRSPDYVQLAKTHARVERSSADGLPLTSGFPPGWTGEPR